MCNSTGCRCICTKNAARRSRCRVITRSKRTCMHTSRASAWLLNRRGHCFARLRVARQLSSTPFPQANAYAMGAPARGGGWHRYRHRQPYALRDRAPKQANYFAASIRRRNAVRRAANLASTSTADTKLPVLAEARDRSTLACSQASYSIAFCCRIT